MAASSSQLPCGKYDVFISFRGPDVRFGFLSHLVRELRRKNIDVYVDDRLERGEEISSSLVNAIKGSMIVLVIFSKDYASSRWCLEELVKIMECKETGQQIVIPVFYLVDPSDVRHKKRTYAKAFTLHKKKFKDKVQIWRSVLKESANLSGYDSSTFQDESKLIDAIVEDVLKRLKDNSPIIPNSQLIGSHQNVMIVESLMEIKSQEVRLVGIWGMGGIGKTTLAHDIFDRFSYKFDRYYFLKNVREKSKKDYGFNSLSDGLLYQLLDQKDYMDLKDASKRFEWKKVLIVLDDVDNPKQLKDLLALLQLKPGSRVIELSQKTADIAKGIPLALEVLGCHFHSRDKAYWENKALIKLDQHVRIVMHDLIREMAEQIVREERMRHPEKCSRRLKDADEIFDVLTSNKGTDEIEGILLDVKQIKYVQVEAEIFGKMKNLRFLKFFSSRRPYIDLPSNLHPFSNKLRYLHWDHYTLKTLPSGSYLENLVELHMQNSKVNRLWDGKQDLGNLKTINLNGCLELKSIESETHLECFIGGDDDYIMKLCLSSNKLSRLCLEETEVEILHFPISHFQELKHVRICGGVVGSVSIDELCCLTNLEVFKVTNLNQVIDIKMLHSLFDAWRNLRELCLEGYSHLSEIPDNIKALTRLKCLSLNDSAVETLPACINHLSSLEVISLRRCKRLNSILGLPPFLEKLDASECTLLETVSSDSLVRNQCFFNFCNCEKLDERSLQYIQELIFSSVSSANGCYPYDYIACYPGSRVPDWMEYKTMTEAFNATEFTCNLERPQDLFICCVAPPYPVSEKFNRVSYCFSYDENKKFHRSCTLFYPALNRDHVLLWLGRRSYDAGIGNDAKISCKFFLEYWDDEEKAYCDVPVKACGTHLIYYP
ncbi:hypothetical protein K1719_015959 [Acacia pycnantha]|nr:hypothetical protein K1719_015959 [Acacia pycnantha]